LERIQHVIDSDFATVTYTEAIEQLEKVKDQFQYPVFWGADLQTEHERYLTEVIYKKPLFVITGSGFYMQKYRHGTKYQTFLLQFGDN
jgi:asparaginyl-tRNA synthetase